MRMKSNFYWLFVPFQIGLLMVLLQLTGCSSDEPEKIVNPIGSIPQTIQSQQLVAMKDGFGKLTVVNLQSQTVFQSQTEVILEVNVSDQYFGYRQNQNELVIRNQYGQVVLGEMGVSDFKISNTYVAYRVNGYLTIRSLSGINGMPSTSNGSLVARDCRVTDYKVSNGGVAYIKDVENCESKGDSEYNVVHVFGIARTKILKQADVSDFHTSVQLSDKFVAIKNDSEQLSVINLTGQAAVIGGVRFVSDTALRVYGSDQFVSAPGISALEFKLSNNLLAIVRNEVNGYLQVHLYDLQRGTRINTFYAWEYWLSNELFAYRSNHVPFEGRAEDHTIVVDRNSKVIFKSAHEDFVEINDKFVIHRSPDGNHHAYIANGTYVSGVQNNNFPNSGGTQFPQQPQQNQPNSFPQSQTFGQSPTQDLFANKIVTRIFSGSNSLVYAEVDTVSMREVIKVVNTNGQEQVLNLNAQSNFVPVSVAVSGGEIK